MTKITLYPGDNRISLAQMAESSVDSVVCDPPYGLVSMVKRFGKDGSAPARSDRNDGSFSRLSGGFMNETWDGTGIERDPEFWAQVLRVLKPGGYIVAFSSSRTYHHMAVAIEAAGFVSHPMIGWLNGQGFPKAHAADKAIDKLLGVSGEVVAQGDPVKRMIPGADQLATGSWIKDNGREYQPGQYAPSSAEAVEWQGWAYGGQVRKPALEPIYVGQKPFSEKSGAANLLKWGVGAVNVDGCRVPTDEVMTYRTTSYRDAASGEFSSQGKTNYTTGQKTVVGRHPANLIHDGSPEVVALFPNSKGQQGDVRGTEPSRTDDSNANCYGEYGRIPAAKRNDAGSAARFFESYPFEDCPTFYHPKAGKIDRAGSKHPTVKPIALMQALIRHVTPPGGTVLDPFAGSGTTGEAAKLEGMECILMEAKPEYVEFLRQRFNDSLTSPFNLLNLLGDDVPSTDLTNLLA